VRSLRAENEKQLMNNIERGAELFQPVFCNNYFRHMLGFLPMCIRKEPIVDK
jgi:hypothetical protein